ncbi:MAG: efflux RND transporter periplasmic adaptor subunit [Candidatus Acidiferrales bacterium]
MRTRQVNLRLRPIGVATAFMLAFAIAGCGSGSGNANKMTSYSARQPKAFTPQLFSIPENQMSHVKVVTVQPTTLTRELSLAGTVSYNAFNTTPVITQVGGPVSRILVVPGQHVVAGQPMLQVSSPDYSQLLATYLKARDSFRVAKVNYARAQDLYKHDAIAQRDLLQAESDRDQAQADLNASEQSLRILGVKDPDKLAKAPSASAEIPVLAPIGGEVVERTVSPGQVVQAGQTQAFTISNMHTVWVLADVYQADLAYVHVGDRVAIQTDAYPQTFHGRISYISAALDPNTRTLQARIVVNNPNEKLKKDMYCTAQITAGVIRKAIAVPDAAVLRDDQNNPFVYMLNGTHAFGRRSITIGASQNGKTQVLSGLAAGDKIVASGSLFLQFANSFQQ